MYSSLVILEKVEAYYYHKAEKQRQTIKTSSKNISKTEIKATTTQQKAAKALSKTQQTFSTQTQTTEQIHQITQQKHSPK